VIKVILTLMASVSLTLAALAGEYPADLNLSNASKPKIEQVAQADAKDFFSRAKQVNVSLAALDLYSYISGRAIEHGLTETMKQLYYSNTFHQVMTQMKVDEE
jgi:hypothetical protein